MTTSNNFYVYEHWRLDRDECFYVGKGKGKRAYIMGGRNRHHMAIQTKVAREGSAIEVRMVATGLTEDAAFTLERERIRFWRDAKIDLANITDGGEGNSGTERSPEYRLKVSIANKGKKRSDKTKEKMSKSFKGRVVSKITKEKLSKINKGRPAAFKGRKHSDETKRVLSEIAKKRGAPRFTKEQQEKASAWHRGRKRSPETCAKISAKAKGRPSAQKGKPSPLKGIKKSAEFCAKQSELAKLRWEKRRMECEV